MRRTLFKVALFLVLIPLPIAVHWGYQKLTDPPEEIAIATGPTHGRYRTVTESLAREIEEELGIRVNVVHTSGSLENLQLLREGDVQFALYQPGTYKLLRGRDEDPANTTAFVANVYSEVAHFIVHRDSGIETPDDLRGKRVAVGLQNSGDYAASRVLLDHFGLSAADIDTRHSDYVQIRQGFLNNDLDAAFITAGVQAPIYKELFADGVCQLLDIPFADALIMNHISLSRYTIPAGLHGTMNGAAPPRDIQTVALRAQLLTGRDTPSALVGEVTRLVLSEDFLKQNNLSELFAEGRTFAQQKPEFPLHAGAQSVYDPELRPLLNPEFVDATEGMRSFTVSILIACYLLFRWLKERRARSNEHRLDRYIRSLLDIERRQVQLDSDPSADDLRKLQKLLNEVTELRQKALREFSAHELNEDRAADCFLEMSHALSEKIDAKITRQRFDQRFNTLTDLLQTQSEPTTEP